jgi:hypothetical protein
VWRELIITFYWWRWRCSPVKFGLVQSFKDYLSTYLIGRGSVPVLPGHMMEPVGRVSSGGRGFVICIAGRSIKTLETDKVRGEKQAQFQVLLIRYLIVKTSVGGEHSFYRVSGYQD